MTDKPTTIDTITEQAKELLEVKRSELAAAQHTLKNVKASIKLFRIDIARLERLCKAPVKRTRAKRDGKPGTLAHAQALADAAAGRG